VFRPVANKPVSEAIFDQLRDAILGGTVAPGDPLASERALSEEFGVNRHAVREALKRLQQAGLVQVAQGGATRVLDWRTTGGLDLLAQLPVTGRGRPQADVLRSIAELRLCVGTDAARRCAERAPAPVLERLHAAAARDVDGDDAALHVRYAELWDAIIDGADNLAYRLAYNSLLSGLDPQAPLALELFAGEARDTAAQDGLVEAIAARDPEAAGAAATDLLTRAVAVTLGDRGAQPRPKERPRG
jgi:DNA-binding FadR family transcriptional regulator